MFLGVGASKVSICFYSVNYRFLALVFGFYHDHDTILNSCANTKPPLIRGVFWLRRFPIPTVLASNGKLVFHFIIRLEQDNICTEKQSGIFYGFSLLRFHPTSNELNMNPLYRLGQCDHWNPAIAGQSLSRRLEISRRRQSSRHSVAQYETNHKAQQGGIDKKDHLSQFYFITLQ